MWTLLACKTAVVVEASLLACRLTMCPAESHVLYALHAAAIVFMAERLNGLGAKHWQRFSGQDYFDPRGVFFTTLVSGPLVLMMLIVLVSVCARVPRFHTCRMRCYGCGA